MFRKDTFLEKQKKNWCIKTKNDESIRTAVFAQKISTFLYLIIGMLGKRCEGGVEGGLSNPNQGKIVEMS